MRRAVVAVARDDLGRVLVVRRSAHVVAPHAYCFPGGMIEPGETEVEAILRELREELGCAEVQVRRRLWTSVTSWDVQLAWYRVDLAAGAELAPDPREVAEWQWLTLEAVGCLEGLLESNRDFLAAWKAGRIEL